MRRCYFPNGNGPDGLPYVDYVVGDGETDAGPAIDPGVLALYAYEQIDIAPVSMGLAPEPGPDTLGLVGLPVWMWVEDPDATTFGPASIDLSVGPVSVSLTARVERIEWDMGDGTVVTCTGPGTPYTPARGATASPDCGHRYEQTSAGRSGDSFDVTATAYWVAQWSSNSGAGGTLTNTTQATEQVRIGESQVIVTRD
ncbi:hypothetical protein [Aquipuribacter sp. SD81]|uniref:hypothetical protein n=1 Tax=Aquipuribacter sp. SD81 TaxID=3127703 RepID=UPI00301B0B0E